MYDVIVVGAGPAGSVAAWKAADAGARVLVIEERIEDDVGSKVSFDSVTPRIFRELDIPAPEGAELDETGKYLTVFSPDKKTSVDFEVPNYLLDRGLLGRRLLGYAAGSGAEIRYGAKVTGPLFDGGSVTGVTCESGGSPEEIEARVVLDCSGFFATVRNKLPGDVFPQYRLFREDVVAAYREIRPIVGTGPLCPPREYEGYFDFLGYFGGYLWIVREKEEYWNVGIGVQDLPGNPPPWKPVREFCDSNPGVGEEIVKKGYGNSPYIALAGGMPRSVADGFMAVGEAAWQVCPGTGYGVYGGMKAGSIAGPVAAKAALSGDTSLKSLWPYEVEWKRGYGATFAFLDVRRKLAMSMTNEELDYMVRKGLMGEKEFDAGWNSRSYSYTLKDNLSKLAGGFTQPGLLARSGRGAGIGVKLLRHFMAFPDSPGEFDRWNEKRQQLYDDLNGALRIELHEGGYEKGFKAWEPPPE